MRWLLRLFVWLVSVWADLAASLLEDDVHCVELVKALRKVIQRCEEVE